MSPELVVVVGVGLARRRGRDRRASCSTAPCPRRVGRSFPWGTLAVNLTGAFVLGVLVGRGARRRRLPLAGIGLLGAYTTFSTWMLESHRLARGRRGCGSGS